MIAIVDYGAGNLRSVSKAFESLGHTVRITSFAQDLLDATAVVLPGVGSAGNAMHNLNELGLADPICEVIAADTPFFGVCLGLQVLMETSEEADGVKCLGIVPGRVRRFTGDLKVPHMGWNSVQFKTSLPLFAGIPDGNHFYFVHSYYAEPADSEQVVGVTDYGVRFCSVLAVGNIVATQFHPEKSGAFGLRLYDNFARMAATRH